MATRIFEAGRLLGVLAGLTAAGLVLTVGVLSEAASVVLKLDSR